jgi:hypothetical protein
MSPTHLRGYVFSQLTIYLLVSNVLLVLYYTMGIHSYLRPVYVIPLIVFVHLSLGFAFFIFRSFRKSMPLSKQKASHTQIFAYVEQLKSSGLRFVPQFYDDQNHYHSSLSFWKIPFKDKGYVFIGRHLIKMNTLSTPANFQEQITTVIYEPWPTCYSVYLASGVVISALVWGTLHLLSLEAVDSLQVLKLSLTLSVSLFFYTSFLEGKNKNYLLRGRFGYLLHWFEKYFEAWKLLATFAIFYFFINWLFLFMFPQL